MKVRSESALVKHAIAILLRFVLAGLIGAFGHHTFFSDANGYFKRAHEIALDHLPYRDFLWEYPPLAAVPLVLIPLTGRSIATFDVAFVCSMIAIEYTCLQLLLRARPQHKESIAVMWRFSVLPLAAIGYFRLDFIPMACATVAIIAIATGKRYVVPTVVGFGAKLWPLVFGVAMVLERRWRDAVLTALASIALLGAWYAFSPDGFRQFIDFRQGDGFQVESIPGSLLLLFGREQSFQFGALVVSDRGFGLVQVLLQIVFFSTPLLAMAAAWRRNVNLIALTGGLVCVMLLSTRLLSPQFLVWLAPFVAWLWPEFRRPGKLFIACAWITVIVIQLYAQYLAGNPVLNFAVVVRNGLLVWLAVELFHYAFRDSEVRQPEAVAS